MTFTKPSAFALILAATVVLAGCKDEAQAEGNDQKTTQAESARSVEYYANNTEARWKALGECRADPSLQSTEKCQNVKEALNQVRASMGLEPENPYE